eukprot:gene5520-5506_t
MRSFAGFLGIAQISAKIIATSDPNMNGPKYLVQDTPGSDNVTGNWSTEFKDYPGGVEYFEQLHIIGCTLSASTSLRRDCVEAMAQEYLGLQPALGPVFCSGVPSAVCALQPVHLGPITTTYSEVFWTALPSAPLPEALQKRFDGKVNAPRALPCAPALSVPVPPTTPPAFVPPVAVTLPCRVGDQAPHWLAGPGPPPRAASSFPSTAAPGGHAAAPCPCPLRAGPAFIGEAENDLSSAD